MGINLHGPQTTDHRPQTTDGHTLNLSYYLKTSLELEKTLRVPPYRNTFVIRSLIAPLLFYTRETCSYCLCTHVAICITFLILVYPHIELSLFLYLLLNGPDVRGLIASSLDFVWTVLEMLYIVAFRGFSCSILYETTFCVPYSWLRTTFNIHTKR